MILARNAIKQNLLHIRGIVPELQNYEIVPETSFNKYLRYGTSGNK